MLVLLSDEGDGEAERPPLRATVDAPLLTFDFE
jgi:hypothetical protein